MKKNEFRIDNWICRAEKFIEQVDESFWINFEHGAAYYSRIRLTEEWLLKFGFEFRETNYDGGHHYYQLVKNDIIFLTGFESDSEVTVDGLPVTVVYVHQLQNLYFVLTDEELTIKS